MTDESTIEAMIVALVTERLQALVQESVERWVPELVARQLQEEIARIKGALAEGETVGKRMDLEPPEGFDQQIQDLFIPQIHEIARQVAQQQVAIALPEVAERLILAELAQL